MLSTTQLSNEDTNYLSKTNPLDVQVGGDHYKKVAIQPIEYAFANNLGMAEGSIVKYITRWRDKGGIQDLEKIKHYVDLLIHNETTRNEQDRPKAASIGETHPECHCTGLAISEVPFACCSEQEDEGVRV